MNDFEAFTLYVSIKRHFSDKKYDWFKYNGKIRLTYDSFEKRRDKIFFSKLAKHPDLQNYLVANLSENEKLWIRDLAYSEESEAQYLNWLKKQQALSYYFKQELDKLEEVFNKNFVVENNQHPKLLKLYLGKEISLETICILLDLTEAIKYWNKKLEYDPIWEATNLKIIKYTPFIKYDKPKFKKIVVDLFAQNK